MTTTLLPAPPWLQDAALLFLRLVAGAIFFTSGRSHLADPAGRGAELGLPTGFTAFLGAAEAAGALGLAFGVLAQIAAVGLILVMLGAIHRKVFIWKTGVWGPHRTDGWHYDLMLVAMNAVIVAFGPGRWAVLTAL